MRAFLAVELPDPIRDGIAALTDRLRPAGLPAKWVRPQNLHLTLRFLGEVSDEQARKLTGLLEAQCTKEEPFQLSASGLGAFPNLRKPSILWVGVHPLEGPLARIQQMAEEAAGAIGLPAEKKAFHPHVTIARIRNPRPIREPLLLFSAEAETLVGAFSVPSMALFSSELTPHGPIYRTEHMFWFGEHLSTE